jgi:hypothetical protein
MVCSHFLAAAKFYFPKFPARAFSFYCTIRFPVSSLRILKFICSRFSAAHCAIRQGEWSVQDFRAVLAHAVDLSAWHTLQAFGIFKASVIAGVTK